MIETVKFNTMTPKALVNKIRENQNNNGTLKSLFAKQFLGKFDMHELEGLKISIEREERRREQEEVESMKAALDRLGYDVVRK